MLIENIARAITVAAVAGSTSTAQPDRAADDKAAIRAAVSDFIEGYYLSDAVRLERSLHPHFLKQHV